MAYISINITYNEDTLCEEISFSESGEQSYTLGSTITLSDPRLYRDRQLVVRNVNYTEDESSGLSTTVSGFSSEYKYTRKAPNCDISFFTMTSEEYSEYSDENPSPGSKIFVKYGTIYGTGGWTMHAIVQKIVVGWMGLSLVNNLPNYDIGDFSISLGSTFFEAVNSLISEFEPIIVLSEGTLYILEKSGAGALNVGQLILKGAVNRSTDREYIPIPGCIKVEGQEGQYLANKDSERIEEIEGIEEIRHLGYGGGLTFEDKYSGTTTAPDGTKETYYILEKYYDSPDSGRILTYRQQTSRLTDATGYTSYIDMEASYNYDRDDILKEDVATYHTEVGYPQNTRQILYNKISTVFEHSYKGELLSQTTSKYELFIYDSEGDNYIRYDPREIDLDNLEDTQSTKLVNSEIRTTKYSYIDEATYGVEIVIATKHYVEVEIDGESEKEWRTLYIFEHDIVEAGDQQRSNKYHRGDAEVEEENGRTGTTNTLQVYAGSCPDKPSLKTLEEPPIIFSIPTPNWNSIKNCYNYLSAMALYEFQKVGVSTPIIDPLPLMAIGGLGSIAETGNVGSNYVVGYTINIDARSGHRTELSLEVRRA